LQAREDPQPTAAAVPSALTAVTSKSELRSKARIRRDELAAASPDFAQRIATFAEDLSFAAGAVVAGYFPKSHEADPRALMAALSGRGHRLCLPAVVAEKGLEFRAWCMGDATCRNVYGIEEPLADAPAVSPDVIFIPLLAFDRRGHRLGYGAGYYDRALEGLRANRNLLAVGVAYAGQEVALVPDETHDRALDMLISEAGLRRFG